LKTRSEMQMYPFIKSDGRCILMREKMANANPSKNFFCQMLTRDIELKDAIMDLIDNCIDGAIRTKQKPPLDDDETYYEGFKILISLNSKRLTIEDNCGGIPYEIALNHAFRFGADERVHSDENALPTIGLYGIGMKRAIFKLGTSAIVTTRTKKDGTYKVTIPEDWMRQDNNWEFPVERTDEAVLKADGTKVEIHLKKDIEEFSSSFLEKFVNDLNRTIQEHFSVIMQKGLEIMLNGSSLSAEPISFLFSASDDARSTDNKQRYAPYLFSAKIDEVEVRLAVGFYGKKTMPDQEDIEKELEGTERSSQDAGWTVICNDRVVLYNNKDHLTGWGENGVPKYHTQFVGIKGIVSFRSNDPSLLPTTTSKRGINANSRVYALAKKRMCEGLKKFTDYTNKWKGQEKREKQQTLQTPLKSSQLFLRSHEDVGKKLNIQFSTTRRPEEENGSLFNPVLPLPATESRDARIVFFRPKKDVDFLIKNLVGEGEELSPSEVGEYCFDRVIKDLRNGDNLDGRV